MVEGLMNLVPVAGIDPRTLMLAGLGLGVFTLFLGVQSATSAPSAKVRRMRGLASTQPQRSVDVVQRGDTDPTGIFKFFVPTKSEERSKIAKKMRQAGIFRPGAVRNYFIVRGVLGIALPLLFVCLYFLPSDRVLPAPIVQPVRSLDLFTVFQYATVLIVIGFYGPVLWLKARVSDRKKKIEQGLPNALDLLQVAIEAGMGFDTAMNRVAHEMVKVVPPIAEEFMAVQLEIQAGMDRERAFLNLCERTGVEEVSSFANVVLQSAQFGSSISAALSTYANEMRVTRELKAQEKANRLPVSMSAIMGFLMMPTLLAITLTPVAIRWVRTFSEG